MALEKEIETYHQKLSELLSDKGKYVIIHGTEVVGVRDTFKEALDLGYERFLREPFLVRQIQETDPVLVSSRSLRPCPLPTELSPPIEGQPSNS